MALRPSVKVRQNLVATEQITNISDLPPCVIAINRQQVYRSSAGTYTGGLPATTYYFPSLSSGATVEDDTSTFRISAYSTVLRPRAYISSIYGVGEVSASDLTWNLSADPPNFLIAPTASVVFTTGTGTTGSYSPSTGYFSDSNANFIESRVTSGDKIYIKNNDGEYIYTLDVDDIKDQDELEVTARDKSTSTVTPEVSLSVVDAYLRRTLVAPSQTFITNELQVGEYVYLRGWKQLMKELGGTYSAEDLSGDRSFTDLAGSFTTLGITTATETYIVYGETADSGELHPLFYVNSDPVVDTSLDVDNTDNSTPYPAAAATEDNIAYDIRYYPTRRILDGAVATYLGNGQYGIVGDDTTPPLNGSGLAISGQERIFYSATGSFNGVVVANDVIVLDNGAVTGDLTQGNWPAFLVTQVAAGGTHLAVTSINTTKIGASDTGSGLGFSIYDETSVANSINSGASYGAEGAGGAPAGQRLFTSNDTTTDFGADGVATGDIIRDRDGTAVFYVVANIVGVDAYKMYVQNVTAGSPGSSSTDAYFEYEICDVSSTEDAKMEVVSVTDETTIICKSTTANEPLTTTAYADLVLTIGQYETNSANLDYQIKHTAVGSDLTGTVLVSYTAKKTDRNGELVAVTKSEVSTIGDGTPIDPASYALNKVFENYNGTAYFVQVQDDTVAEWSNALEVAKDFKVWCLVPCTQNATVLTNTISHVNTYSTFAEQKHRIAYISHEEVVQTTRTDSDDFPGAIAFTKNLGTGVTNIVMSTVDATAYGAIPGDVMTAAWTDGAVTTGTFSSISIISIQAATPSDGQCTIRIVGDNGITAASGTLTSWDIKSKSLTLSERATQQASWAQAIANERIRNIWPDSCQVTFTDSVGLFGGGDVTVTDAGWVLCAIEAGKRAFFNPSLPLTKRAGGSIYRLVDPMGTNTTYQDTIIDGGNYYMQQDQDNAGVYCIRELTTDVSSALKSDGNVIAQRDITSRSLLENLADIVGPNRLNATTKNIVMLTASSVIETLIANDYIKTARVVGFTEDPETTTFTLTVNMAPYAAANFGIVDLNIGFSLT